MLLRLLLHRLVLVVQLVRLKLEEVGQLLGLLSAAAAPSSAATTAHLHLHVAVELLRTLEMLQRHLLNRQRGIALPLHQLLLGGLKCLGSFLELLLDERERRVRSRGRALGDLARQRRDLLAQPPLRDVQCRDVLAVLPGGRRRAVPKPVEGAGDDFALARHESLRRITTSSASATTATRFGLTIILPEWPHLQEVDIAHALVAGAVLCHRVVRDQVARGELELLEEERVCRARFESATTTAVRKRQHLLLATIHAVAKLERLHAVVIRCRNGDGNLLDVRDLRVTSRLRDAHGRRTVRQRLHGILHGAGNLGSIGRHEVNAIESRGLHRERCGEPSVASHRERNRGAVVEGKHSAADGFRDRCMHGDGGAHHRGHVAPLLDVLGRHPRVRGEAQVHRERAQRGQVGDRERIRRRANAVRVHEILGRVRDVEHSGREGAGHGIARHRYPHPLG